MKKHNPLNIWTLEAGYCWRYPSCWGKNLKFEFRKFKYAWDRITKGYCDYDIWDLDNFYTNLFIGSLARYLEENNGWPDNQFEEFEQYQDFIKQIIYNFNQSIEGNEDIKNEYQEAFDKYLEDPTWKDWIEGNRKRTPEEEEVCHKYYKRDAELAQYRLECFNKAFDMLKKVYHSLWW